MRIPGRPLNGPVKIRHTIECARCGRQAQWTGGVYECVNGHEIDEKDAEKGRTD